MEKFEQRVCKDKLAILKGRRKDFISAVSLPRIEVRESLEHYQEELADRNN